MLIILKKKVNNLRLIHPSSYIKNIYIYMKVTKILNLYTTTIFTIIKSCYANLTRSSLIQLWVIAN